MPDRGLDKKMEELAHFVADSLLSGTAIDKEFNDAFKTLAGYWSTATKLDKVGGGDEDAKSGTFSGMKARIRDAGDKAA